MYEKRKNDILDRINQGNIYFSIISMISCTLIFLLLFFNKKKLENLTFNLLKLIFISEIVNNIGNLFQINYGNKVYNLIALSLISFSDIFTNILFLFFSYCSIKIIKESKRENKDKISKYILISFLFSLLYALIVLLVNINENENIITDIRFKRYYYKYDKDNGKIFGIRFYICSFIHTLAIILISFFNFNNTYKVLVFLRDKKKKR